MAEIKLVGGFYQSKSLIAEAQKCLNLYPEQNPEDAPFPFTTYPTPGLRRLTPPIGGGGQGLYTTIKGDLFAASGGNLYSINRNFTPNRLASVNAQNLVSMSDNADAGAMIVVDGTSTGLMVDLNTHATTVITDDAFYGGTRVDFVDGYFVLNVPQKNEFYISNPYSVTFNPLYFAGKTGGGDPIILAVCLHREIWLFGTATIEVWGNTGQTDFPYQPLQGIFIQQGLAATGSVATQDLSIYWLGQNKQGQGLGVRGNGYQAKRISTHAIEVAIQSYSTISDARGFIYQQEGHVFYVLTFPTAGATWVFDEATQLWHQRGATDMNGNVGAIAVGASAFAYGQLILQDINDGSLYTYDLSYSQDDTAYGQKQIRRERSFPHLINDGKRLAYSRFIADVQTGNVGGIFNVPGDTADSADGKPQILLTYSDDRGATWSTPVTQTFGATGQTNTQVLWTRLGMAKDRVFKVSWTTLTITALNGAFVEARPAVS